MAVFGFSSHIHSTCGELSVVQLNISRSCGRHQTPATCCCLLVCAASTSADTLLLRDHLPLPVCDPLPGLNGAPRDRDRAAPCGAAARGGADRQGAQGGERERRAPRAARAAGDAKRRRCPDLSAAVEALLASHIPIRSLSRTPHTQQGVIYLDDLTFDKVRALKIVDAATAASPRRAAQRRTMPPLLKPCRPATTIPHDAPNKTLPPHNTSHPTTNNNQQHRQRPTDRQRPRPRARPLRQGVPLGRRARRVQGARGRAGRGRRARRRRGRADLQPRGVPRQPAPRGEPDCSPLSYCCFVALLLLLCWLERRRIVVVGVSPPSDAARRWFCCHEPGRTTTGEPAPPPPPSTPSLRGSPAPAPPRARPLAGRTLLLMRTTGGAPCGGRWFMQ